MPSTVISKEGSSITNPHILALSCKVPKYRYAQEEVTEALISALQMTPKLASWYRQLAKNSAIQTRYSCLGDLELLAKEGLFLGCKLPDTPPSLMVRNERYRKEAPPLAKSAVETVLKNWGKDPGTLTHLISVSCTGMQAPGLEVRLIDALGLNRHIERVGVNFMGCFGAIRGLALAKSIAAENPQHRVLLITTELCSLHFDSSNRPDALLGNALFADGAAAALVGMAAPGEAPLWEIVRTGSYLCKDSIDEMRWDIGASAFEMRLTKEVPKRIAKDIRLFAEKLLNNNTRSPECAWAIHPGGRAILEGIEEMLQLKQAQTQASWDILAKYGNMSSPTFLFVLDQLKAMPHHWTAGLAFGPGLALEGLLLQKSAIC